MEHRVYVLPQQTELHIPHGTNLMQALRGGGCVIDAPCGGNGTCGKCLVTVNGRQVRACCYTVESDLTVELPEKRSEPILTEGLAAKPTVDPLGGGYLAAIDVGTTTVVCALMDSNGNELAVSSGENPQRMWGADVISRIQHAMKGQREALTAAIQAEVQALLGQCCKNAEILPEEIGVISLVGNSCMQQLFLGMDVANLAGVPFAPVITQASTVEAAEYLPLCANAALLIVPDMDGFVGADTMGCILAAGLHEAKDTVLLVDIGTNGELALAHQGRLAVCSTAAGPALEGGNIRCGMRAAPGAIDRVYPDGYHVIGDGEALGICGSGLVDAAAVMLEKNLLNARGRVLTEDHCYALAERVILTQEDIRQLQMAKGAIASGIELLAESMRISLEEIDRVILAGAFGSFLNVKNACRIGLLPPQLESKIITAGNIALSGAKALALNQTLLPLTQQISQIATPIDLSQHPHFRKTFAQNMLFPTNAH